MILCHRCISDFRRIGHSVKDTLSPGRKPKKCVHCGKNANSECEVTTPTGNRLVTK